MTKTQMIGSLLAVTAAFAPLMLEAAEQGNPTKTQTTPMPLIKKGSATTTPVKGYQKKPGMATVFCLYDYTEARLEFIIPSGIQALSVTVQDASEMTVFCGSAVQTYPYADVSLESGCYTVTCETPEGDVYEGIVDL